MRVPIVFVDANVFFSKTLRDWVFMLRRESGGGMFALHTSEDSLTEALYWKRKRSPQADGSLTSHPLVERIDGNAIQITVDGQSAVCWK